MSGAVSTGLGLGSDGVDSCCDRQSIRSRESDCAPYESGGSPRKPIKAKSPPIAERAQQSQAGPTPNTVLERYPPEHLDTSRKMASSEAAKRLAASDFDAVRDAVEHERQRISRDLHDHAGQYLVGIALRLAALERKVADPSTNRAFAELRQLLDRFCDELRSISRGEHPGLPLGCDLVKALINLTSEWESETGIAVHFRSEVTSNAIDPDTTRVEPDTATSEAMFRIAQEALTNIAKHATNASHVTVQLEFARDLLTLTVADDGPGFEPGRGAGRPVRRGGLINMHERLTERGGQLVISCPPTGGTSVVAMVPIVGRRN